MSVEGPRPATLPLHLAPAASLLGYLALAVVAYGLQDPRVEGPDVYLAPVFREHLLLVRLAFLGCCAVLIATSHLMPRHRDAANVLLGAAWMTVTVGWSATLSLVSLALLVYFAFRELQSHLAMALTAALLLAGAATTFYYGTGVVATFDGYRSTGAYAAAGYAGARILCFAYNQRVVPVRQRSILRLLAYGPCNLTLYHGDPHMVPYAGYHGSRLTRDELTRLGSVQLYRSGFKRVLFALVQLGVLAVLPDLGRFGALPLPARLGVFAAPYVLTYLKISLACDLSAGVSNLAGYHVPDAFDLPLLARDGVEFWHRWNVTILRFLQQAFIVPTLRVLRARFGAWPTSVQLVVAITVGLYGSALLHVTWRLVALGTAMRAVALPVLLRYVLPQTLAIVGMIATLPLYFANGRLARARAGPLRALGLALFWAGTQLALCHGHFGGARMNLLSAAQRVTDDGRCMELQLLAPRRDCARTIVPRASAGPGL